MRKHSLLLGAACIAASSASMAFNPVQGWYVGAIGLVSYAPALNFYVIDPLTGDLENSSLNYRIGGGVAGLIGYRCAPWRFEGEVLFNINTYSKLTIAGYEIKRMSNNTSTTTPLSLKGDTYIVAGMVNVFYDFYQSQFSQDTQIVPYLGLGAGYASVHNELRLYSFGTLITPTFTESSGEGAVQFIIGAQYFADDFTSVGLDYRYFMTSKIKNSDQRYRVNTLNLTLNFAFDQGDYS